MTVMQASIVSTTTTITNIALIQEAQGQCKKAASSNFDALLSMVDMSNGAGKSITASSANASNGASQSGSLGSIFDVLLGENSAASSTNASGGFGFSSDFTSTFGDSGPLLDFIKMITSSMHLNADQNQALQNIAIKHANDSANDATVASIAAELGAAGIA